MWGPGDFPCGLGKRSEFSDLKILLDKHKCKVMNRSKHVSPILNSARYDPQRSHLSVWGVKKLCRQTLLPFSDSFSSSGSTALVLTSPTWCLAQLFIATFLSFHISRLASSCTRATQFLTCSQGPTWNEGNIHFFSVLGLMFDFLHARCPFSLTWLDFLPEPRYKILPVESIYENNDVTKYETFHL